MVFIFSKIGSFLVRNQSLTKKYKLLNSLSKPITSNASILIHDLMGKLIKRINLTQETKFIQFDLNEFPSGAYTISLQDAQGVLFNSKLIKTP